MRSGARLFVLNGRGRSFELTGSRWRGVQWRRFLQKYLIGEILFVIGFGAITPWMIVWDWLHGRK